MAYMMWTEAYSTGVPSIDEEHQELVGIANQLHDLLHACAPENEVKRMFARLTDCTTQHFRSEERHFVGTDYPRATIHARKHQHLLLIFACLQTGFDRTGKRVPVDDQLEFLRDWLLDHIASEDRWLGSFLNAQKCEKSPVLATSGKGCDEREP